MRAAIFCAALVLAAPALAFDHSHAAWDALVKKHVRLVDGGKSSRVRYADFATDRAALKDVLAESSKVDEAQFRGWTKPQQMAFLINAYNAWTVELILTKYPDLKSIRDLGNILFNSPWKRKFFTLFGRESSLDQVEHEMLRKPGVYDEPRVHYAVNCASVGCPMLREEAFVAARLDAQLEEQARRFLSDRSRNRYSAQSGKLEVSEIFKWFKEDWSSGYRGIGSAGPVSSREQYFARYADLLADGPGNRRVVAEGRAPIDFLDYDWSLNDAR
ncbi:MAG: DUF547 domain-containing protein [Betaproteobacteria bacterium]|nr:DUF547 domain-containing protein [Betaproteobacteria bacterium]